jgi:hypothetical protein
MEQVSTYRFVLFWLILYVLHFLCTARPEKTNNCLVLNDQGKGEFLFLYFGEEADNKLSKLPPNDKYKHGFRDFKLKLFNHETRVLSHLGLAVPLEEVIAHTIRVCDCVLLVWC